MKTKFTVVLAVLAGVVIGALAVNGLHAQAPSASKLPAFYIAEFEVTDPEGLKPYSARVASTLEPFGGRFIVRGGKIAPLEGEAPKGLVVIAFESMEKAQAWYDSPAYQELRPIRHKAAKSLVFIVEGTAN
jgi:uncharacterized protein (DUF1330 family)